MRIEIASIDVVSEVNMVSDPRARPQDAAAALFAQRLLPALPAPPPSCAPLRRCGGSRRASGESSAPVGAQDLRGRAVTCRVPSYRADCLPGQGRHYETDKHMAVAHKNYLCCWDDVCVPELAVQKCSLPSSKYLLQV